MLVFAVASVGSAKPPIQYHDWAMICFSRSSGSLVTMPGSYLIYGAVDQSNNCYGGIQENTGIGFSIYGLIFLKSQYIVFDQTTASAPKLGFARQPGVAYV